MKSFIGNIERLQMPLALAVVAVAGLGVLTYKEVSQKPASGGKQINQLTGSKLSVVGASPQSIDVGSISVEVPPTTASSPLQAQATGLGQAASSPLQSNTNVNDPAVANNPLVQSLFTESGN